MLHNELDISDTQKLKSNFGINILYAFYVLT